MRKFNLFDNSHRFFKIITDNISRLSSLVVRIRCNWRIITDTIKKLMGAKTTIDMSTSINSQASLGTNGGNILLLSTFRILNSIKKFIRPLITINIDSSILSRPKATKKIRFNTTNHFAIFANAIVGRLRPFGGDTDNPNYDPDGIDALTFNEIDDWSFNQCDRIGV